MPRPINDSYDEDENRDTAQDLLWTYRIKATIPRRAVIDFLFQEDHPVSIEDIKNKLPKYDVSSLYRAMELFEKHGLVNKINTGTGRFSFEIVFGRKHHHHLICTDCGDMEDSKVCLSKDIEKSVLYETKKFSTISRHSLEFFGICKKCVKK